jgi:hypothetical protein
VLHDVILWLLVVVVVVFVAEEGDMGSDDAFDDDEANDGEEPIIFNYDDNNALGGTALIQKTVELVSAHKMTIAEMVEVRDR